MDEPCSGDSSRGSSVQPPPKRNKRSRDDEGDVIVRHLRDLEERCAESRRRADRQRAANVDEDELFGQQVATTF